MAKIFSVDPNYEIEIDDHFILRSDDDFVSIQIPNFNWHHHSNSCNDCKALIESFGKKTYEWLFQFDGEVHHMDLDNFGPVDDHFVNSSSYKSGNDFTGSRMKFKLRDASTAVFEAKLHLHALNEEYERCKELKSNLSFLKNAQ